MLGDDWESAVSIRLRLVDGVLVALCAARSIEKPGDIYLDDGAHHALTLKFWEDFASEGSMNQPPPTRDAELRAQEESNNQNRESWDRTYGFAKTERGSMSVDMKEQWEAAKLRAYRQARIFEPNREAYHAAMAVYAAAFGKPDGEPEIVMPDGTTKQPWEL